LKNLEEFQWVARSQGNVDVAKWDPPVKRLLDRIAAPDVATALTDDQAIAVYGLAESIAVDLAALRDPYAQYNKLSDEEKRAKRDYAPGQTLERLGKPSRMRTHMNAGNPVVVNFLETKWIATPLCACATTIERGHDD